MNVKLRKTVATALFAAIAFLSVFLFRISGIGGFLTFDAKDFILLMCGFFFGPSAGLAATVIAVLFETLSISSTGIWGFLMNLLSSGSFVWVASLIYRQKRTFSRALWSLLYGSVAMISIMTAANLIIDPIYMHVTMQQVAALIPGTLLPFNFLKAVLNCALVLMLYKPLSNALKRAHLLEKDPDAAGRPLGVFSRRRLWILILSLIAAIICLVIFFCLFDGHLNNPFA